MSAALQEEIMIKVNKLLDMGLIPPIVSSYSAPVLLVPDPLHDDVLDKLQDSSFLSCIDL